MGHGSGFRFQPVVEIRTRITSKLKVGILLRDEARALEERAVEVS